MQRLLPYFLIGIILTIAIDSDAQPCSQLPKIFKSYEQAIERITHADFKIKEITACSRSSWIEKASFYSCDGNTGYFLLTTKNKKQYLHSGLPIKKWYEFKNSSSFGSYYNRQIKGRYQLKIPMGY